MLPILQEQGKPIEYLIKIPIATLIVHDIRIPIAGDRFPSIQTRHHIATYIIPLHHESNIQTQAFSTQNCSTEWKY